MTDKKAASNPEASVIVADPQAAGMRALFKKFAKYVAIYYAIPLIGFSA